MLEIQKILESQVKIATEEVIKDSTKPSWAELPEWAECLGFAFSGDDDDLYNSIYGKELVDQMKGHWCYFSFNDPVGIANLEYRPEDNIIKKYIVWLWTIEGVGINFYVETTLSKTKLQKYYYLKSPTIKKVDVYTKDQEIPINGELLGSDPTVKVEPADYDTLISDNQKHYIKLNKEFELLYKKLANPNFKEKAPKSVVLKCQSDYEKVESNLELLKTKLNLL
jgi:hypothetical protein